MHLWNEYEGRIVADQFPLVKLLEPEGRSAFFSTTDSGKPAVIRLIEAHFDEPEILARWSAVSKIDQPNLVKIGKFGQTTLDETALLYAVMEPTDAALADILKERALSSEETMQIATSLVPALQALHAQNLVHEHLEPANVLAIGEMVKLRSDCIREAPEGAEGNEAKARDVQALATLLLRALTLQRKLPIGATLPAPFHQIVVNGISGTWGLPEIAAALPSPPAANRPVAEKSAPATARPTLVPPPTAPKQPSAPTPSTMKPGGFTPPAAASTPHRLRVPVEEEDERRRVLPWTTIAAAIILAIFIGWHFLHKAPAAIPTLATMPTPASPVVAASNPHANPATPTVKPANNARPATGAREQWRVIAYTYNHKEQAQQKAAEIASRHAFLNPEVFAPKGHAPYLVTVGGAMGHDEALAFRKRARSAGLPRDTYAQNFPAKAR